MGFIATGPIQYAGVAYSVGEYTYEYAVNDKMPDEVIEAKVAWFFGEDEPEMTGYAKAIRKTGIAETPPIMAPKVQLAETSLDASPRVTLDPAQAVQAAPVIVASLRPKAPARPVSRPVMPTKRQRPMKRRAAPASSAVTATQAIPLAPKPQHTYVEREIDPLLEKLTKLEHALAQAEQIVAKEPINGVRYSVSSDETGQAGTGISGSWSIRHGLMQHSPGPLPESVVEASPVLDGYISS